MSKYSKVHVIRVFYWRGSRMDWNRSKYIASRNVGEVLLTPKTIYWISKIILLLYNISIWLCTLFSLVFQRLSLDAELWNSLAYLPIFMDDSQIAINCGLWTHKNWNCWIWTSLAYLPVFMDEIKVIDVIVSDCVLL